MQLKNFVLFVCAVVLFFSIIPPVFALSPVFDREIVNPLEGVVSIFTALAAILGGFVMWIWSGYKNKSKNKIVGTS